jgi:excisionase family DNA binding protein
VTILKIAEYLTAHEAARRLGLEYKTLLKRVERGKVKHEPLGRMKLIPVSEVDRLKREQAA